MYTKQEKIFITISCILSVMHALGYVWLGLIQGFNLCIIAMITLDVLYIPVSILKSIKLFPTYLVVFSCVLVYITAFTTSELYNNYSALLCLFVGILIKPKYKTCLMGLYLIVSSTAFVVAGDPVYFLVIHFARALWIFTINDFIIAAKYERKPVILFDEEIEILEQLTSGAIIKELDLNGYSERTIRRRLDAAQKRNGLKDRDELKELYIKTYKK